MTIRNRKVLTGLAAATLIAIAAAPAAADRPNDKNCPGEITWGSFVTSVLIAFGFNPGEHIQGNCL